MMRSRWARRRSSPRYAPCPFFDTNRNRSRIPTNQRRLGKRPTLVALNDRGLERGAALRGGVAIIRTRAASARRGEDEIRRRSPRRESSADESFTFASAVGASRSTRVLVRAALNMSALALARQMKSSSPLGGHERE